MSKLEELLQGVDVKWKALGDICIIKTGQSINKIQIDKNPGIYPVINSGKEPLGYINNWNTEDDPIGIASRGAGVGQVTWTSGKYFRGNLNYSVTILDKSIIQNKYLFYVLLSMQMQIHALCTFDGIPALNSSNLKKLLIPIPPIEIQQEIVRVLDELTSLTNQLTTELETERQNRKKQFEFFREQLFTFEEGSIIFNKLGEIGEFQRGKRFVKTDMITEGVPCIHYGEMYTHYGIWANKTKSFLSKELVDSKKLRLAKKNDVIMVAAGETIEDIGKGTSWLSDQGVVFHDACFSYTSPLNPSYVAYFTRTKQFHDQIRRNISSGKISAINSKGLEKVYIPIPSLAEQERIVKLLDQFDSTHTAIEEEITKEIKLRTQQYEYYREKLLSFLQN